jgi:hypothetical protein
VGRSDRRDPFFKGLRFAPASDVATIADRSVARIDLGQSGGYAFAWLPLVMLVFSEPTSLYWDAEAQAEHLGRKPEPFQPMRRMTTFPRTGAKVPRRLRGGAFGKQDISQ